MKSYYEKRKTETYDLSNGVSVHTNGVGPFLLNWILPQFNFRPASDYHDIAYSKVIKKNGKLVHAFTKHNADTVFLKKMLLQCKKYTGVKRKVAEWFAHRYYEAVRDLGKPFYEGYGNKAKNYIYGLFKIQIKK